MYKFWLFLALVTFILMGTVGVTDWEFAHPTHIDSEDNIYWIIPIFIFIGLAFNSASKPKKRK